jgi:phosphonate transport system substrate-binding protein
MNRIWRLLSLSLLVVVATTATAEEGKIVLGSVAMDVPAVMYQRLDPLVQYLARQTGHPAELRLSPSLDEAVKSLATGQTDIAYLTPVAFLKARKESGARPLVKLLTLGQGSFNLMIVVRQDSPIKSVSQLAGKRFALGDKSALLQRAVVVGAGMPLEKLGEVQFLGHYDNIARAVNTGEFDAGILKDTTAREWQKKGLRVIHTSVPLPPYVIAVRGNLDEKSVVKLRQALLALRKTDASHLAILKALDPEYDGFAPTSDAEYDVVRDLIAPFQKPAAEKPAAAKS